MTTQNFALAGVIGWPIHHSRSPRIHNHWLKLHGIAGTYLPLAVAPGYLARLNRGIQKSWVQVLAQHDASPWPPLTASGAALRKFRAWFTHRAWSSPAAHIRWQGACGHFAGRIARCPR